MCGSNIAKRTPLRGHELYRGVYSFNVCAFDRRQAIELFFEEFKNDSDIKKVRISRVSSEKLPNNEVQYTIFFRLIDPKSQRIIKPNLDYRVPRESLSNPRCSECRSITEKMGVLATQKGKRQRYRCKSCGKTFSEPINGD